MRICHPGPRLIFPRLIASFLPCCFPHNPTCPFLARQTNPCPFNDFRIYSAEKVQVSPRIFVQGTGPCTDFVLLASFFFPIPSIEFFPHYETGIPSRKIFRAALAAPFPPPHYPFGSPPRCSAAWPITVGVTIPFVLPSGPSTLRSPSLCHVQSSHLPRPA
jgi:hypothetical protein